MRRRYIAISIAAVLVFIGGFFLVQWRQAHLARVRYERLMESARAAIRSQLKADLTGVIRHFPDKAGIVITDLERDWTLNHQKDMAVPAASMTKLPIMAAVFLAAEEGKIRLDEKVALRDRDKMSGSGILKTMPSGTEYTVEELMELMIGRSDNTATNILTGLLGMDYLNDAFRSFGLTRTLLTRRIADYKARSRGFENYTTAADIASMLERIYRGELINRRVSERCIEILKLTRSRDRIPKYLPKGSVVAHKTGLERTVCHDAGIVFTPHGDFLICVLVEHDNPSASEAKAFIARVAESAHDHLVRSWTIHGEEGVP